MEASFPCVILESAHLSLNPPPRGRVLVVGDVHGCRTELERLLAAANLTDDDRLIFVGDLVNNGPDSAGVVRIARERGALATVGNHELRLLRAKEQRQTSDLKRADYATIRALAPDDWNYLATMALTIEIPAWETLIVHGGFLPDIPWKKQSAATVTEVQVLDRRGRPQKRTLCPEGTPWADLWEGPPFVVYGHTPMREVARYSHALGIDTGCVYGGHLTGVLLPDRRLVQVPAARRYRG